MKHHLDIYDNPPARKGTGCVKHDGMKDVYGEDSLTALWVADMDFPAPEEVCAGIQRRAAHPVYGYSTVPESYWDAVIRWIARGYGFTPGRNELAFIPGIVRGIGFALNYYTAPGDKVLIMPPVYHPFKRLTEGNGRVCVETPLTTDSETGRFTIDFTLLRDTVANERPAMMILCNPHNPGGRQWTLGELERVAAIADEFGVKVISDEIHGDLMLGGCRHICYFEAGEAAVRTGIVFGAPSKTFNIPGLASSWIAIRDSGLRSGFYNWLEVNEFSTPPTMFSVIATEAAYRYGEPWLKETLGYITGNLTLLLEHLKDIPGIKAVIPDASYLVWLDCRGLGLDQAELNRLFTHDARMALNDGAMFGKEGEGFMRLNLGLPRKELDEALVRLRNAIKNI